LTWVLTLTACSRIKKPGSALEADNSRSLVSMDVCLIEGVYVDSEEHFKNTLHKFDRKLYKVTIRHTEASSTPDYEDGDLPECACTPTPPPGGPQPTPPSGGQVTQHFKLNGQQLRELWQHVSPTPTPNS